MEQKLKIADMLDQYSNVKTEVVRGLWVGQSYRSFDVGFVGAHVRCLPCLCSWVSGVLRFAVRDNFRCCFFLSPTCLRLMHRRKTTLKSSKASSEHFPGSEYPWKSSCLDRMPSAHASSGTTSGSDTISLRPFTRTGQSRRLWRRQWPSPTKVCACLWQSLAPMETFSPRDRQPRPVSLLRRSRRLISSVRTTVHTVCVLFPDAMSCCLWHPSQRRKSLGRTSCQRRPARWSRPLPARENQMGTRGID
mmetsp:Transcript_27082/g.65896  ORF Transcript_27082/g.65896 Transcript_27082/m.65896 type:complete len:248 (+) Transcript_27082:2137-2880(+)